MKFATSLLLFSLLAMQTGCGGSASQDPAARAYYGTKTPYQPQQDAASYEAPPPGYVPVHIGLVARHGSRGLTTPRYDLAMYAVWLKAQQDHALTPLGEKLGPDILRLMRANALLGYGVPGIAKPGYGNLSQQGIAEHRQLAVRMLARLRSHFDAVGAAAASAPRRIVLVSSGVDRAEDSGNFFTGALTSAAPALAGLVYRPPAPNDYPTGAPVAKPDGTNRFLLYFFALKPGLDAVDDPAAPYFPTYRASLDYQSFVNSSTYAAVIQSVEDDPQIRAAARRVMERLFSREFVDKVDNGSYAFSNSGRFSFTTDDGAFTTTIEGDGKTRVAGIVDVVNLLYNLYVIAPSLSVEAALDFTPYLTAEDAQTLTFASDADDFYTKGPSFLESGGVTYRMAQVLVDDFFNEVDAIARGDLRNAAKLRFGHAETTMPLATLLGLKNVFAPLPRDERFSYDNNPWRGDQVAPMAANMQWDVFRDASGKVLVRMLYNERETDFKASCDAAKLRPDSHFYRYEGLKACYGHVG